MPHPTSRPIPLLSLTGVLVSALIGALTAGCMEPQPRPSRYPADSTRRHSAALRELRKANKIGDLPLVEHHCKTLQYRGYPWAKSYQREACRYLPRLRDRVAFDNTPCPDHVAKMRARIDGGPGALAHRDVLKLARCGQHDLIFHNMFTQPARIRHTAIGGIRDDMVMRQRISYQEAGGRLRVKLFAYLRTHPTDARGKYTTGRVGSMMGLTGTPAKYSASECAALGDITRIVRGHQPVLSTHQYMRMLRRGCTAQLRAARPAHISELAQTLNRIDTPNAQVTRLERRQRRWMVTYLAKECDQAAAAPDAAVMRAMEGASATFRRTVPSCMRALGLVQKKLKTAPGPAKPDPAPTTQPETPPAVPKPALNPPRLGKTR